MLTNFLTQSPDEIISDYGGELNSKVIDNLCGDHDIKDITTSPYHQQSNGLIENFNGTLKVMINKLVDDDPENWDKYINKALFAYRVGTHDSTKISLYEAMHTRKPILPNQASLGPVVQQT